MAQALQSLVRQIRTMAGLPRTQEVCDRQLLERFVQGEESAFAALVQRHGAMVLGVCRRVLQNGHDAEDAFQATFLVLARKAAGGGWQESIGNWLHGVAYRIAMKARAGEIRRRQREQRAAVDQSKEPDINWSDLRRVLDEELERLPSRYRAPLLLCYLEGKTRDEAAQELGWSAGSVKGRLERGRELLRERLARRGLALSAVLCASLLPESAAGAAIPATLAGATVQAGMQFVAGQAAGIVSAQVLSLTQGALHAMLWTKIKTTAALILTIGALGIGGAVTHQTMASSNGPAAGSPTFVSHSVEGVGDPVFAFEDEPGEPEKERPQVFGGEDDVKLYPLQPGRVLFVAPEGKIVKKGDIILSVDQTLAKFKLQQAKAALENARLRLEEAKKKPIKHALDREMQKAAIAIANSKLKAAEYELEKRKKLFQDKVIGKEDLEIYQESFKSLKSLVQVEKNKLKLLELVDPLVDVNRAQQDVDAKEAQKGQAEVALKECTIRAPFDGKVMRVFVRPGDILPRDPKFPAVQFSPKERGKEGPQIRGEIKAVDAEKGTITMLPRGPRGEPGRDPKTFNLADKDIKVATNFDTPVKLAELKAGMLATLSLSADMDVVGIRVDAPVATGILNLAKFENKKTIINIGTGRGIGLFLHLEPDARFSLDGKPCKFTDIRMGSRVVVYMTLDRKGVVALRAGEEPRRTDNGRRDGDGRDGRRPDVNGVIVGIHKNSIDVLVGADDNFQINTYELAKGFVIQAPGREAVAGKVGDLVKAIRVGLSLSEDKKTVARIQVVYPVLRSAILAVDADKKTVTLHQPRSTDMVLTLAKDATITIDGKAGSISDLNERIQAVVTLSLDRRQITSIVVGGRRPDGR
jgi:RNA polymerase sigma factor (sigma-70 family)